MIGGRDNNNKNIYIGQAYIKDKGLVVVQIDQGKRSVYAEMDGIQLVDQNIKVCSKIVQNLKSPIVFSEMGAVLINIDTFFWSDFMWSFVSILLDTIKP